MEFFGKISGRDEPQELPKPAEMSQETKETLDLVRETLGDLGESFLRRSQSRLVESFDDDLTRNAVKTLMTSVKEYREGLSLESRSAKAVKTAEAMFNSVIWGSEEERTLRQLHDYVIDEKGGVKPGPEGGGFVREAAETPEAAEIKAQTDEARGQIVEQLKSLYIIAETDFGMPEDDLALLDELRKLVDDPSFDNLELLELLGDYSQKLMAASSYSVMTTKHRGVVFESLDVIQDFLSAANDIQRLLHLAGVKSGDRFASEVIAQVSGAYVLRYFLGPVAENLVTAGAKPKDVAEFLSEHPQNAEMALDFALKGAVPKDVMTFLSQRPDSGPTAAKLVEKGANARNVAQFFCDHADDGEMALDLVEKGADPKDVIEFFSEDPHAADKAAEAVEFYSSHADVGEAALNMIVKGADPKQVAAFLTEHSDFLDLASELMAGGAKARDVAEFLSKHPEMKETAATFLEQNAHASDVASFLCDHADDGEMALDLVKIGIDPKIALSFLSQDPKAREKVLEASALYSENPKVGRELVHLVAMGGNPKEVLSFLDQNPDVEAWLVDLMKPLSLALSDVNTRQEIFVATSEIHELGSRIRDLLASKETRPIGTFAFGLFMQKLERFEGLTSGHDLIKEGSIDELNKRKGVNEKGDPIDTDFSNLIPCATEKGPVQVPWGFIKDFSRSIHTVNGTRYRSSVDLQRVKQLEESPELVGFLNDCLDNGLSRHDLEAVLLSTFQVLLADVNVHSAEIAVIPSILINPAAEGAEKESHVEYFFDFNEDGTLDIKGVDTNIMHTEEGLTFGYTGEVRVNFGRKEDGTIDYAKGDTVSAFKAIAEINDPTTLEEKEKTYE